MPLIRSCDFCGKFARYDGPTRQGPWAYMCRTCWSIHGVRTPTDLTKIDE